jgi:arylsulfatase A-like enzyme
MPDDRIADEGMRFTDAHGEQSRAAGYAAFISGQSVFRTAMSKVGTDGRRTARPTWLRIEPIRKRMSTHA